MLLPGLPDDAIDWLVTSSALFGVLSTRAERVAVPDSLCQTIGFGLVPLVDLNLRLRSSGEILGLPTGLRDRSRHKTGTPRDASG